MAKLRRAGHAGQLDKTVQLLKLVRFLRLSQRGQDARRKLIRRCGRSDQRRHAVRCCGGIICVYLDGDRRVRVAYIAAALEFPAYGGSGTRIVAETAGKQAAKRLFAPSDISYTPSAESAVMQRRTSAVSSPHR